MWLRGILPNNLIVIPPEDMPPVQSNIAYINPLEFEIKSGTYYGDASGGEHTRYPDIRRVGVSFVRVSL